MRVQRGGGPAGGHARDLAAVGVSMAHTGARGGLSAPGITQDDDLEQDFTPGSHGEVKAVSARRGSACCLLSQQRAGGQLSSDFSRCFGLGIHSLELPGYVTRHEAQHWLVLVPVFGLSSVLISGKFFVSYQDFHTVAKRAKRYVQLTVQLRTVRIFDVSSPTHTSLAAGQERPCVRPQLGPCTAPPGARPRPLSESARGSRLRASLRCVRRRVPPRSRAAARPRTLRAPPPPRHGPPRTRRPPRGASAQPGATLDRPRRPQRRSRLTMALPRRGSLPPPWASS